MKTYPNLARFRGWTAALLALSLIFGFGCGGKGGSKTNMLSGKVFYNDQPLTGGTITLHPADDKGGKPSSVIAPDGAFAIPDVPTGEMKVTVETESIRGQSGGYQAPPGRKAPDMGKVPKYVQIPRTYADANTTSLHVTLNKGKNNQDFKLNESGK